MDLPIFGSISFSCALIDALRANGYGNNQSIGQRSRRAAVQPRHWGKVRLVSLPFDAYQIERGFAVRIAIEKSGDCVSFGRPSLPDRQRRTMNGQQDLPSGAVASGGLKRTRDSQPES